MFKSASEQDFALYLDHLGLFWDYERPWGVKHPDFTVYSDPKKQKIIAVVEIEDIDFTPAEKRLFQQEGRIVRSEDNPYKRIRTSIADAAEQLKFAKEHPCLLIIKDNTFSPPEPVITMAAMLGDLTFSFPIKRLDGKSTSAQPYRFFGKGGKMVDPKHRIPQNTTITAIGFLDIIRPDVERSGLNDELSRVVDSIPDIISDEGSNEYFDKAKKISAAITKKGFNLEETAPAVVFTISPIARKKFPHEPFSGEYSYIHEYDMNTGRIEETYNWSK